MNMKDAEFVKMIISAFNQDIDHFYQVELPEKLGVKPDEKINLKMWFKANQLIHEQKFYETRKAFLEDARKSGHDVKISMIDYKLSYHGMIE